MFTFLFRGTNIVRSTSCKITPVLLMYHACIIIISFTFKGPRSCRSVTLRGVVKYQPGNAPRVLSLELTSMFR